MALFGRKQQKATKDRQDFQEEQARKARETRLAPYSIHVMPRPFRAVQHVSKKHGGFRWLLVAVGVLIVVLGASAAFYYFFQRDRGISEVGVPLANTTPSAQETPTVAVSEQTETVSETSSTTEEETVTTPQPIQDVRQPDQSASYEPTIDTDEDGLTNTEETLYQTETRVKDTDGDGFDDGTEIKNGFNPRTSGGRLAESGLVNVYQNPVFGYTVLHPASWLARATDSSLEEVIFQSTTGEYVAAEILENPAGDSLLDWYLKRNTQVNPADIRQRNTAQQLTALRAPDGLSYYIADPQNTKTIFVIRYEIGNRTKVNFLATFEMMVNSFHL